MKITRAIRLVKNAKRSDPRIRTSAEVAGPKKWSKAVRIWVNAFQARDRDDALPSFDSLFKDGSPTVGRDKTRAHQETGQNGTS